MNRVLLGLLLSLFELHSMDSNERLLAKNSSSVLRSNNNYKVHKTIKDDCSLAIACTDKQIISARSDGIIKIYDVNENKNETLNTHPITEDSPCCFFKKNWGFTTKVIALSDDNSHLISGGALNTVQIWNLATRSSKETVCLPKNNMTKKSGNAIAALAFIPNSKHIFVAGYSGNPGSFGNTSNMIVLYNTDTQTKGLYNGDFKGLSSLAINPSDKSTAIITSKNKLTFVDLETMQLKNQLDQTVITKVIFNKAVKNQYLTIPNDSKKINIYNLQQLNPTSTINLSEYVSENITDIALDNEGRTILAAAGSTCLMINQRNPSHVESYKSSDMVSNVAMSSDGSFAAFKGPKKITLMKTKNNN